MVAKALTIAGSDSGGGAGIQADLKAFSANDVYGASVLTVVTAQNTTSVTALHEIPTDVVHAQIIAVLSDIKPDTIKIGMLFSPEIIACVAHALKDFDGPVVVDPVMIAKSGDVLLQESAIAAMKEHILPRADLLTPNLPEAVALLAQQQVATPKDITAQANALQAMGAKAVLIKGGHGTGKACVDMLLGAQGTTMLSAPRITTRNTHGTGCTYSATIAANLAKGLSLVDAVTQAHRYLHNAIKAADQLDIGTGHGPVHHFHASWG